MSLSPSPTLPALLLAALVLSGCAGLAPQPAPPLLINAAADLRLSGKLSVQVAGASSTGRDAGGNAGFELAGSPAAGSLELSTPLGGLLARAIWGADGVRLQTPSSERRFGDLDALSRELLGEAIPVAALFDWLQGRPWPQAPSGAPMGKNPGFEQLGWQIDLSRFEQQGLIVAVRQAAPVVTLRARIER